MLRDKKRLIAFVLFCFEAGAAGKVNFYEPMVVSTPVKAEWTTSITRIPASTPVDHLKSAQTSASLHLHEWVFSGASAGLIEMALQSALSNGELKKVYYADYEQVSILGFVTVFNVTAYGE